MYILSMFINYFVCCSFSALSSHFKDLHLFSFDDEELETSKDRLTPTAKRISEGWIAYSLVEIKQRYNISGKVNQKCYFYKP